MAIVGSQILVDDRMVGTVEEITTAHRLQNVDAVRDALIAERRLWKEPSSGREFPKQSSFGLT